MVELAALLSEEDPAVVAPAPDKPPPELPPAEAFEHFRGLYLRYLRVFQDLNRCFEGMIHPQKRADVGRVIETVMVRLVQLRHALVKWHPLNPEVAAVSPGQPLPWEYIAFDDKLLPLRMQPEALEVPVPGTVREALAADHARRDSLVSGYMQLRLGVDRVYTELDDAAVLDVPGLSFSVEEAVAIIQRMERGRQGKMRAAVWRERRAEEARAAGALGGVGGPGGRGRRGLALASADASDDEAGEVLDPEDAAVEMQRLARGFIARRRVARERSGELVFLGMRDAPRPALAGLEGSLAEAARLRRLDRANNKAAYDAALGDISKTVLSEEGAGLRDRLRAERTRWFTSQLTAGEIPENLEGFYAAAAAAAAGTDGKEAEDAAAGGAGKDAKGGKGGKDAGKGGKADAGKDAKGKGKGKGAEEEAPPDKPPPAAGTADYARALESLLGAYDATWVGRDERENVAQRHDAELARETVRPGVEGTVRAEVDAAMEGEFKNFKAQALGAAGDKKKKDKKDKKGKKGKKDGKKGKKEKPLPGAKLCSDMDNDKMLSELVEARIINHARPGVTFAAFLGGINLLGSKYAATDTAAQRHPTLGHWIPAEPSMAQLREALLHYAVLPLSSAPLRKSVNEYCAAYNLCGGRLPRSLLLYGPHGAGKTHLTHAIANATGALVINLSAANVDGKFAAKGEHAKLLHMAFEVAKDPAFGPVVIYIDGVEKMLPSGGGGGKKKGAAAGAGADGGGASRFKKELPMYIKSLNPDHAAIVIATTAEPEAADSKALMDCFDKMLYVPCPDYGTRVIVWRNALQAALTGKTPAGHGMSGPSSSASAAAGGAGSGTGSAASGGAAGAGSAGGAGSSDSGAAGGAGASSMPTSASAAAAMALAAAGAASAADVAALPIHPAAAAVTSDAPSPALESLNISALAGVSSGYTVGSICKAVRATLTARRLERLPARPLTEQELLAALARCPRVYADDVERYRAFTDAVTGLAVRRAPPADDAAAGGKGGKGGKDAKGKKK